MDTFRKILVPVDLSANCQDIVPMATEFAKASNGSLIFCYVTVPPLPDAALYGQEDIDSLVLREHAEFKQIRPTDLSVEYDHLFLRGNPGPEILKAAEENDCDLVLLTSHGRTGIVRWLMGSVAEYISRNAKCAVLMFRGPRESISNSVRLPGISFPPNYSKTPFVTSAMQHTQPIHDYQLMDDVIAELKSAGCSAAPVVDGEGNCIGILTETDVQEYRNLKRRLAERDESVLDQVYETDEFGMRRASSDEFHHVKRHMKSPVVCVPADATCNQASETFDRYSQIHHLVVLGPDQKPQGIVEPNQLRELLDWNMDCQIYLHH